MSGLTSTWLNVFPLYTPMIEPTISGTMTVLRRWVRTGAGFSLPTHARFAVRSFLMSVSDLRCRPREKLWRWGGGKEGGWGGISRSRR